jgi:polysaccharide export outer membrane protein
MASRSTAAWFVAVALSCAIGHAQQAAAHISPRDQLKVTVFGLEGLSGDFQVDADGTFKFPPLGLIKAGGLTAREVETLISNQLASGGYAIRPPQVTIAVQAVANKSVIVSGEVKSPGTFSYAGEMTLYQALVKAGLPTLAAGDQVLVVHDAPATTSTQAASQDGDDIETRSFRELETGSRTADLTLRDGDRVFVKKAGQVYIGGFVRNPGAYTIESSGVTLKQALTLAGGVTERGSEKRVEILRKDAGKDPEKLKDVTLNTLVKPQDTITVKARIF